MFTDEKKPFPVKKNVAEIIRLSLFLCLFLSLMDHFNEMYNREFEMIKRITGGSDLSLFFIGNYSPGTILS